VLATDGFLLISTPDKSIYSTQLHNENPFHVRELERREFEDLLATQFSTVRMLGQKLAFHSVVWPLQTEAETGTADSGQPPVSLFHRQSDGRTMLSEIPPGEAVYLIAACAADTVGCRQ